MHSDTSSIDQAPIDQAPIDHVFEPHSGDGGNRPVGIDGDPDAPTLELRITQPEDQTDGLPGHQSGE